MLERCACGLSVGKVSLVFQVYRNSWLGAELGDGLPFVVVDLIVLEMKWLMGRSSQDNDLLGIAWGTWWRHDVLSPDLLVFKFMNGGCFLARTKIPFASSILKAGIPRSKMFFD
jgi:hypothetical protein